MSGVDVRTAILIFVSIVLCITVHEFGHAIVADRLGDDTPRRAGRISLNPLVIMRSEPLGAVLFPILGAISGFLFGFASTPVNVAGVRRDITLRKAQLLITGAGVVFNVLFGVVCLGLYLVATVAFIGHGVTWVEPLYELLRLMIMTNLVLALFNLFPIAPLDGYTLFEVTFGDRFPGAVTFLKNYGMLLLILVFFYGGTIIMPAINFVMGGVVGLQRLVL